MTSRRGIGFQSTPDTGFTEAAADAIFASIVKLDQSLGGDVGERDASGNLTKLYDANGDLIRKQGALFDSLLHFIGYSRGTVVESEIIQRLGTYFPHAGGVYKDASGNVIKGDLQMTTIDLHDFKQDNLNKGWLGLVNSDAKDYSNFYEPEVKVWDNVTFADNYYQTRTNTNVVLGAGSTTPNGRFLDGADVNKNLTELTGFKHDNGLGANHGRVLTWYAGTLDLSLDGFEQTPLSFVPPGYQEEEQPVYDQLGESALIGMNVQAGELTSPWYDGSNSSEGIGTGWFYSYLGGGEDLRAHSGTRLSVKEDNTNSLVNDGDGVIPTVFNGNFDVGVKNDPDTAVPGWCYVDGCNGDLRPVLHKQLADKNNVSSIIPAGAVDEEPDPDAVVSAPLLTAALTPAGFSDFALKLNAADPKMKEYVHNLEIIPDWGAFRFDLHIPAAAIGTGNGKLNITIQDSSDPNNKVEETIYLKNLFVSLPSNPTVYNPQGDPIPSTNYTDASIQLEQKASVSFESFSIDIPDRLHGKVATIKLEAKDQSGEFLIDNIGFKNANLKLGNPGNARSGNTSATIPQYNKNFLIERPQYAISYNAETNTANWASWELNRDFLQKVPARGGIINKRSFKPDTTLPSEFYQPQVKDYLGDDNKQIKIAENGVDVPYVYGHLVPVADRNTNSKDNLAISLLSNIVPQTNATNNGVWKGFEDYTRRFVTRDNNKDVFIVAGTYGTKNVELAAKGDPGTDNTLNQTSIKIPEYLWKVILVVNKPGLEAKDITSDNAYAIGLWMPNDTATSSTSAWRTSKEPDGTYTYLKTVDFIESQTGYDFFSYLSTDVQSSLESNFLYNNKYREPSDFSNGIALLAADNLDNQLLNDNNSGSINAIISNTAIWHDGVTKKSTTIFQETNSTHEISIGQVGISKESSFQNSVTEISLSQVGSIKPTLQQFGIGEISTNCGNIEERNLSSFSISKISSIQDRSFHVTINNSASQVSSSQVGSYQFGSINIGSFKNSSSEVGADKTSSSQFGSSEVSSTQIDPTKQSVVTNTQLQPSKVSLSSSVSSQQFFPTNVIHENTSNLLTNIFSTAQSIWQSQPINLTFKVTNLPKGQLAEAQVDEFGANGLPIQATILIDDDANGVGWFIDTTPGDSSEFTGTDTYLQATPNSTASGKYDLLTTILHEMGHTLGIINGYSEFDKYIKGRKFTTDTFTAQLTPDGSHLDTTFHPYDLMNTSLKPGVRKLPSTLNLAMINAGIGSRQSVAQSAHP
jgi:large repetitive protein